MMHATRVVAVETIPLHASATAELRSRH